MLSAGKTDKGIVRRDNQDFFLIDHIPDRQTALYVVCDGMGGASAGNIASKLAAEAFIEALRDTPFDTLESADIFAKLENATGAANATVYKHAKEHAECRGMGTTLVGAVLVRNKAYIINVGDSRAYRISDGQILQVTRDHSLVEDMVFRGDITRDEALHHPNRNLITRALGTDTQVAWDVFDTTVMESDRLLLCSDGLTNLVSDGEILEEVTGTKDPEKCAELLIHLALSRGGSDNITVVLAGVSE